jgi:hypothetical protein
MFFKSLLKWNHVLFALHPSNTLCVFILPCVHKLHYQVGFFLLKIFSKCIATGYRLGKWGLILAGAEMRPVQTSNQWVLGALSTGISSESVKLTTTSKVKNV